MPVLSVSGATVPRHKPLVRPKALKRPKRRFVKSIGTRGAIVRIDGMSLAVGCSAVYKEYQALRKTPEFKLWWNYQYAKQHAQCYYCLCDLKTCRINVEHIQPMSKGGTNNKKNMVLSCASCNKDKGSVPLKAAVKKTYQKRLQAQVKADRSLYRAEQFDSNYQAELGAFYRNNF